MRRFVMNWVCAAVVALMVAVRLCTSTQAQAPLDEAKALNARAEELNEAGKAGEAIPLAARALAMREAALPAGHPTIAQSLNNLARLYDSQGRLSEAEPLFKRALAMRETALPAGHPDIATRVLPKVPRLPKPCSTISSSEGLIPRCRASLFSMERRRSRRRSAPHSAVKR